MSGKPIFLSRATAGAEPHFASPSCAEMVVTSIYHGRDQGWYYLIAFVVLPDELALIVVPRKQPAHKIVGAIEDHSMPLLSVLVFGQVDIWDERFRLHNIKSAEMLRAQIDKIHHAPVMLGLCRDAAGYAFSSANPRYREMLDY